MLYRKLGSSDLNVSRIALGTWLTVGETITSSAFADIIAAADQVGINTIDTADSYVFGDAESAIGTILKNYPPHHFLILTKCYFSTDRANPDQPAGLSRQAILKAAEASLQRLGVDHIDLLQCHRHDPNVPVEETVIAMEHLVQQGKIRWWGVSKWPNTKIVQAYEAGAKHLISRQELYNLFHREPEMEHFDFDTQHNLGFLAYSPLARGMLTGKYQTGIPPDSRAAHTTHKTTVYDLTAEKLKKVARLSSYAQSKKCTTAQLALAYYLHLQPVTSTLVGASSPQQLKDNAKTVDIFLSADNAQEISSIFSA